MVRLASMCRRKITIRDKDQVMIQALERDQDRAHGMRGGRRGASIVAEH